jgi:hypothetical protein
MLPLSEYCRPDRCRTHDESSAAWRSIHGHVRNGSCGSLRYIQWGDMSSSKTEYFDAKGQLVGAVITEDYELSCPTGAPGTTSLHHGEVPDDCP